MTKDKESRKDWAPKFPKAEKKKGAKRDRTPAHEAIREQYRDHYLPRRSARAKSLRQGLTTMSLAEMCNVANPYWETANSLYSLESGYSFTSEVGLLWWSKRLGIHPAMVWINRPNCIKGWDGLLNQTLHVFEQTPDGSSECQAMQNDMQAAIENAMEYFQKREERRAEAAAQEEKVVVVPAGMVDDLKAYVKQTEEGKKMLKEKWGIDL